MSKQVGKDIELDTWSNSLPSSWQKLKVFYRKNVKRCKKCNEKRTLRILVDKMLARNLKTKPPRLFLLEQMSS